MHALIHSWEKKKNAVYFERLAILVLFSKIKLQGCKEKLLSRPGKEILIKSISQDLPIYMMSIFCIPDGLIDEIHSIMAQLWWGNNGSVKTMH